MRSLQVVRVAASSLCLELGGWRLEARRLWGNLDRVHLLVRAIAHTDHGHHIQPCRSRHRWQTLDNLYPRLSVGGYVVFDDWKLLQAPSNPRASSLRFVWFRFLIIHVYMHIVGICNHLAQAKLGSALPASLS